MSLSLVERIRSEMAGVNRWNADTRGTLLFECLEAFAARAEGDPAAEGDIPSIIERGQTGERLSPTEQSAWTGYELGWKDGLKHAISDLGECFECGHDLNGPYCPACNSDIDAARAEGVAALQQAGEPVACPREEIKQIITANVRSRLSRGHSSGRYLWSGLDAAAGGILAKLSPLPQQTALVEEGVEIAAFLIEQDDEPLAADLGVRMNYWRDKCITAGQRLDPKRWGPK